ncbi:isoaspartyl peptidase/L-asparaginase [Sphingomonas sp. MMS24-JH45]
MSLILGALMMTAAASPTPQWSLVIHGGAGVIERERLTPAEDEAIRAALASALDAGQAVLAKGGAGQDAVEAAVKVLEATTSISTPVAARFSPTRGRTSSTPRSWTGATGPPGRWRG